MAAKVGGVIIGLRADTVQFEKDMGKASQILSNNALKMESRMKGLEKSFTIAGTAIGATLGAGMAIASYKLVQATDRMRDMSDQAQRLGVSVEKLQEFRQAAAKFGVDVTVADQALQALSRNVAQATQQQGALYDVTKQYGISVTDAEGRTRPLMAIYRDLADAARKSNSATEAGRITTAAMGDEAQQLAPLLRQGAGGFDELAQAAHNAGDVISKANVDMVADLKRQYDEMFEHLDVQWMKWAVKVGQMIKWAGETFGLMPENSDNDILDNKIARQRTMISLLAPGFRGDDEAKLKRLMQLRFPRSYSGADVAHVPVVDKTSVPPPAKDNASGGGRVGSAKGPSADERELARFNERLPFELFQMQADNMQALTDEVEAQWQPTQDLINADADYIKGLYADAEAVKDSLDPTRALTRERDRLNEMNRVGALSDSELAAALAKVNEEAVLASNSLAGIFARGEKVAEDALTSIDWMSGHLGRQMQQVWKETANSIINDLLKMAIGTNSTSGGGFGGSGVTGFITKLIGLGVGAAGVGFAPDIAGISASTDSMLGGLPVNDDFALSLAGGMASGGRVEAGTSYIVGEHGRERFTPDEDGYIEANSALESIEPGGNVTYLTQNIVVPRGMDPRGFRQSAGKVAALSARQLQVAQARNG